MSAPRWEVLDLKVGQIVHDQLLSEGMVRVLVMRGPAALCAYVGVPKNHPLAGFDYNEMPLDCHGGLTWGREGDGAHHPADWYWYGWDYAHGGDRSVYTAEYREELIAKDAYITDEKEWTVAEVVEEAEDVAYQFSKLVEVARVIEERAHMLWAGKWAINQGK